MHKVNQIKGMQGRLQGGNNLEEVNDKKVIKDTFKVVLDTFTLAQDYKRTL
jgi:hypothetical protein